MKYLIVLALIFAVAAGAPSERIVMGTVTTINNYPAIASVRSTNNMVTYWHNCGGNILNERSILTAGHCTRGPAAQYQIRLGSSFSNSGGILYAVGQVINHPQYNVGQFMNNDISILQTILNILFSNTIMPASLAGPNYSVSHHDTVTAAGWGVTEFGGVSQQLRHVELWAVNRAECNTSPHNGNINDNMICSVNLGTGRGQCNADSGGPLYHRYGNLNVVVGLTSYGPSNCGHNSQPVVSTRVSQYIGWIQANA